MPLLAGPRGQSKVRLESILSPCAVRSFPTSTCERPVFFDPDAYIGLGWTQSAHANEERLRSMAEQAALLTRMRMNGH